MNIIIIGAGSMGREYIKSLYSLGYCKLGVLSNTEKSASLIKQEYSFVDAYHGGLDTLPHIIQDYDAAIIASPIETLLSYLRELCIFGIDKILVEKPVALSSSLLNEFISQYPHCNAMVAFNRLYFPSVLKLRQRLKREIVRSAEFSFTEWVHRINVNQYSMEVMRYWGASNCIHVLSTVFDLIGKPISLSSNSSGFDDIDWHPSGSIFCGSGITERDVLFSYMSDWGSAGRWTITIRTDKGAYFLEPMETLQFLPKGTVEREMLVAQSTTLEKCGLPAMLDMWLRSDVVDTRSSLQRAFEVLTITENIMYNSNCNRH